MIRGNRQGNNAFMEEYTHEYASLGQMMKEDERMHVRVGYLNPIPMNSLVVLAKISKNRNEFFKQVWYHALRIGDREAAAYMLEFLREDEELKEDISDECL